METLKNEIKSTVRRNGSWKIGKFSQITANFSNFQTIKKPMQGTKPIFFWYQSFHTNKKLSIKNIMSAETNLVSSQGDLGAWNLN